MKKKLGPLQYLYPVPIVLVGTVINDRVNFTEIGDCAVGGINPPLLIISLHEKHYSAKGILEKKAFSINIPNVPLLEQTDFCGIESGNNIDKSRVFNWTESEKLKVPLIDECPMNFECSLITEITVKQRRIFVAEITETYINEDFLSADKKGIKGLIELDPILYALDNKYYRIGEAVGEGYREGKSFKIVKF